MFQSLRWSKGNFNWKYGLWLSKGVPSDSLYNNNMRPCALFDVLSSNSGHTNPVLPRNNNVPIHVRSYQMLHVCFLVQIHPSICFSSYEAVCRLVAQNSNHRKSVILYLVITLSVNVSPRTQFHPSWVKVINNLLIKSFSQQSPNSGENTRTKSIVWRTSWEMAQTVSEFLVHSRISGSLCLVPKFSKTSYHERSHV